MGAAPVLKPLWLKIDFGMSELKVRGKNLKIVID